MKIICESTGEVATSYQAYLKTKHWTNIRWDMKDERCLICDRKQQSIHHRTYDNLGHEEPEDFFALCGKHHMLAHGIRSTKEKKKKKQKPKPPKKLSRRKLKKLKFEQKTKEFRIRNSRMPYVEKEENGLIIKVYGTLG